jgi:hypothetical protein
MRTTWCGLLVAGALLPLAALSDNCNDDILPFFFKNRIRTCTWVGEKIDKRCNKPVLVDHCPETCEKEGCGDGSTPSPTVEVECSDHNGRFPHNDKTRTCKWVGKRANRCAWWGEVCPLTCGLCDDPNPTTPSPVPDDALHIETDKVEYDSGEAFEVSFVNADADRKDWIGIYAQGSVEGGKVPATPAMWLRTCGDQDCAVKTYSGKLTFSKFQPEEGWGDKWPLDDGEYEAVLVRDGWWPPYTALAQSAFTVADVAPAPTPPLSISILTPGDEGYAKAITTTNRFCHVRCPATVVQPENAAELAHWMRSDTNPFTVKGGGHSYACQSVAADGGTLVDTSLLNDYEFVNMEDGTTQLKIGAGLRFIDVLPAVKEAGFSMPHGECSTVGIAGYILNNGDHPDLRNLDRLYETPYVKKIEGVTTRGSIIQVDEDGVTIVESSTTEDPDSLQESLTQALTTLAEVAAAQEGDTHTAIAATELELVQQYGANMLVATTIWVELLAQPEPFFAHVIFDASEVLAADILRDLFYLDEDSDSVDCGIIIETHYSADIEVALLVKCVDWDDQGGVNILNVFQDYSWSVNWEMEETTSAYFLWHASSHGLGWVPRTYYVVLDEAVDVAAIVIEHLASLTECANCFAEFNQYQFGAHLDYWCSDMPENKDRCVADTANMHERIEDSLGVSWWADPHLPNCEGDTDDWWDFTGVFSHYSPIMSMSRNAARNIAEVWDEDDRLGFWMGNI